MGVFRPGVDRGAGTGQRHPWLDGSGMDRILVLHRPAGRGQVPATEPIEGSKQVARPALDPRDRLTCRSRPLSQWRDGSEAGQGLTCPGLSYGKGFAEWFPPEPGTGSSSPAAVAGSPSGRQGSGNAEAKSLEGLHQSRQVRSPPKKLDAPTPGPSLRPGAEEPSPQLHDLLNAGGEKYDGNQIAGSYFRFLGSRVLHHLRPFFIPGPTPKAQDSGIKIPTWSSQSERFLYCPIRTKQESICVAVFQDFEHIQILLPRQVLQLPVVQDE
ncbi:hypothetical protein DFAR_1040023 [Desulfarculales bacterium]